MNNIIKQLKKEAKNTRLSSVEKAEMRSVLLQHVASNPVSAEVLASRGIPSPFMFHGLRNKKTISAMVIGSLLVGSSVSFAAEAAVPGDILYPVKVGVNENVRKAVAITPEAKAALDVALIERRLVEVEKLAMKPSVPVEIQQQAAESLKKYTRDAEERLETVENDNDGDEDTHIIAMTHLSTVLNTHERILDEIHSDIVKDSATSTRSTLAKANVVFATTTASVPSEHAKNPEPVKVALDNVRESIKEIETKSEELKKKHNKSLEATSTTQIVPEVARAIDHNQDSKKPTAHVDAPAQPTLPVVAHPDEHQAVIESHHDTSAPAASVVTTSSPEQKNPEVKIESHKTSTSTVEWHKKEDAHSETSITSTSTPERD